MTTFTADELGTRVLRDLGLVGADETPSAADLTWAVETCQSEIALMSAKGIQIWNGSDISIPLEYLTTLSRRIGLAAAPSFGLTDIASATVAIEAAERDLRTIGTIGPTGDIATADYF